MELLKIVLFCIVILFIEAFFQGSIVSTLSVLGVLNYPVNSYLGDIATSTGTFFFYKLLIELWLFVGISTFRSAFRSIRIRDLIIGKISASLLMFLFLLGQVFHGIKPGLLITYLPAVLISYFLARKLWVAAPSFILGTKSA